MTKSRKQMQRLMDMNQAMFSRMVNGWMISMGSWGWSQEQSAMFCKDMMDRAQMATSENVKALQNAFMQMRESQVQLFNTIAESVSTAMTDSDVPDLEYITSLTRLVNDLTAQTVTSISSLSSTAVNTASELSASVKPL